MKFIGFFTCVKHKINVSIINCTIDRPQTDEGAGRRTVEGKLKRIQRNEMHIDYIN